VASNLEARSTHQVLHVGERAAGALRQARRLQIAVVRELRRGHRDRGARRQANVGAVGGIESRRALRRRSVPSACDELLPRLGGMKTRRVVGVYINRVEITCSAAGEGTAAWAWTMKK